MPDRPRLTLRRAAIAVALICVLAASYLVSLSLFETEERAVAQARVGLYRQMLDDQLSRFSHLPDVLAETEAVARAARGEDRDGLNRHLERVAQSAGLEAIYLLDPTGLTVAASNHAATFSIPCAASPVLLASGPVRS